RTTATARPPHPGRFRQPVRLTGRLRDVLADAAGRGPGHSHLRRPNLRPDVGTCQRPGASRLYQCRHTVPLPGAGAVRPGLLGAGFATRKGVRNPEPAPPCAEVDPMLQLLYDARDDPYHERTGSQLLYWLDDLGAVPLDEADPARDGFLFAGAPPAQ